MGIQVKNPHLWSQFNTLRNTHKAEPFPTLVTRLDRLLRIEVLLLENETTPVKRSRLITNTHGVEASLRYTAAWQSGAFPGDDIDLCFDAKRQKISPSHQPMVDDRNLYGIDDDGRREIF